MTINQLITVRTLIDTNFNVTETARKLQKVQSAISNQIHTLEAECGGPLFERKGKRLIGITPLCKTLLPVIDDLLNARANINTLVSEYADEDYGELRIATTHTQARYFLSDVIEEFRDLYPEVRLSLNLDNPSHFPHMLREREVDIAIFAEDGPVDSDFTGASCYRWNRVLVVKKGHPIERQKITLDTIAAYPVITYMKGYADRSLIDQTFQKNNLNINVACSAGDADIILRYVRLNIGIGIVSQMAGFKEDKDLQFYDLSKLFGHSTTRVVYDQNRILRKYMKDFIELLRRHGKSFENRLHQ